jgi:glucosylceramidase
MNTSQRNNLMERLFNPANGIGISFVRIPMGASDFSVNGPYSYDDLPPGQTDPTLSKFSINHDTAYILPILKQALALNPSLKFMANPWSPPAWMKTNGSMFGTSNGQIGTLIPSDYSPLAQYFVKFIQAYQAQGIPIYAITPQNEPGYAPDSYPGMILSSSDESNFIQNYLSPALKRADLHPKIIPYDHNWDNPSYATTLLRDPATNGDIAGISWHCYAGSPTIMSAIHDQYPTKDAYETECATGASVTPIGTSDLLMQSVQNWAKAVELWNIALDSNHGPHSGGCPDCLGVVTVDPGSPNVVYTNDYYMIGQFSKFVVPGAYRIGSNSLGSISDVAFKNPDGSKVVVVYNDGFSRTFTVRWNGSQSFTYTLPAGAMVTFKWT